MDPLSALLRHPLRTTQVPHDRVALGFAGHAAGPCPLCCLHSGGDRFVQGQEQSSGLVHAGGAQHQATFGGLGIQGQLQTCFDKVNDRPFFWNTTKSSLVPKLGIRVLGAKGFGSGATLYDHDGPNLPGCLFALPLSHAAALFRQATVEQTAHQIGHLFALHHDEGGPALDVHVAHFQTPAFHHHIFPALDPSGERRADRMLPVIERHHRFGHGRFLRFSRLSLEPCVASVM
jgi:hypothetical protein